MHIQLTSIGEGAETDRGGEGEGMTGCIHGEVARKQSNGGREGETERERRSSVADEQNC